jgi:hypothetical protein
MTTSYLNLTLFDTASGGSQGWYSYVDGQSSTSASSNMNLIDDFASKISGSVDDISGSVAYLMGNPVIISGCGIMSNTTGSKVVHNFSSVTSGSYDKVSVDEYGHVISGSSVASPTSGNLGLPYRQGGDPSDWTVAGTNSYTPSAPMMQTGVTSVTWPGSGGTSTDTIVTFPTPFSAKPVIFINVLTGAAPNDPPLNSPNKPTGQARWIDTTGFSLLVFANESTGNSPGFGKISFFAWMAIGEA